MKRTNKKGFTIVELVIVIAVIAILAAVLIPTFSGIVHKANESAAMQEAKSALSNVLSMSDNGTLPEHTRFIIMNKEGTAADYEYEFTQQKLQACELNNNKEYGKISLTNVDQIVIKEIKEETKNGTTTIQNIVSIQNYLKTLLDIECDATAISIQPEERRQYVHFGSETTSPTKEIVVNKDLDDHMVVITWASTETSTETETQSTQGE